MKKVYLFLVVCFILLTTAQGQTVSLQATTHTVDPRFLGLNGRSTEGPSWDDATFLSMVADMGPGYVRYPGGTQGNQWDWHTGTLIPQLGTTQFTFTIPQVVAGIPANTNLIYVVNMVTNTPSTGYTLQLDPVTGWYTSLDTLTSQTLLDLRIQDMLDALATFESNGHLPEFVEIGNEHYFNNSHAGKYGQNPTLHLNHAKQIAQAIHTAYPTIKFLFVTTQGGTTSRDAWNTGILNGIAADPELQALAHGVVQHHYINDLNPTNSFTGKVTNITTAETIIDEGVKYTQESLSDYNIPTSPLKLWLTEFGATKTDTISATMWCNGLRTANMTFGWLNMGPKIQNVLWHHITDGGEVLNTAKNKLGPCGIAVKQINKAFRGNTSYKRILFSNMNINDAYADLYGYYCTGNGDQSIVIVNKGGTTYSNINLSGLFTETNVKYAKQYYSTTPYIAGVDETTNLTTSTSSNTAAYTINPYSITTIVLGPAVSNVNVYGANGITEGSGYTTLKAAVDAINAQTDQTGRNIVVRINASTTETATVAINQPTGMWNSYKIVPTTSVTVTGNIAGPLVQLNGADKVNIEGRLDATSTLARLSLVNTSTSNVAGTSTIQFINDAVNDTVQYCNVKGSSLSTVDGIISFGTTTGTTGNDDIIISNNKITSASDANRPLAAIYSLGTATKSNSGLIISNNNIYNCLNRSVASTAITLTTNTTDCSITGNSFYEVNAFTMATTSVPVKIINIDNTTGGNFVVSDNYIGGNGPLCAGTFSKTANKTNEFTAIFMKVLSGGGTASSVQNNTIKNISWLQAGGANVFYGINVSAGTVNVGDVTGNTIGSNTAAGSITYQCTGVSGAVYGIYYNSGSPTICSNNNIGGITAINTNAANAASIYGIYKTALGGATTISNNYIGSETIANSLNASSATTSVAQGVYGIYILGTNLYTITNNRIVNLSNAANPATEGAGVGGIYFAGTNNTLGHNTVSTNFIAKLGATNALTPVYGIKAVSGATTYSKNIVSINPTTANTIYGIYDNGGTVAAADSTELYFNTVYIGGTASTGALNSYALYSKNNLNARDYRDNIFHNARTNSGATGKHYAAFYNYATAGVVTNNYNNYYASGTGAMLANYNTADQATLANLQTALAQDANSTNVLTTFSSAGGTLAANYKISNNNLNGIAISGLTTDFEGATRLGPSMGAYETAFLHAVDVYIGGVRVAMCVTLKEAFDAINNGTHTGSIVLKIVDNSTETASCVLNASGTGSANYTAINIYPTLSNLTISGNLNAPLIDLNGADNVIIDGRINGTGAGTPALTLSNASTSNVAGTSTVRFINDATTNTLRYCVIKGSTTSTVDGIVSISTTTGPTGNDNNTITRNKVTSETNRPIYAIASIGTTAMDNNGLTISNNEVYDVLNNGATSTCIYLGANTTTSTITANSIYETTTFVPTLATTIYKAISIENTAGVSYTVSSNYIGGTAALCGGTAWTKNTLNNEFNGIYINTKTSGVATEIQGNTIQNISWSNNSGGNKFYGINVLAGVVNIGNTTGNIIGSASITGSINYYATVLAGGWITPINLNGGGAKACQNNYIGGITAASNGTNPCHFYGIVKAGTATATISNNTIGGTLANSIQATSTATGGSAAQTMYGIQITAGGAVTVNGNSINNMTNSSTNVTNLPTISGIYYNSTNTTLDANNVSGNFISGLTSAAANSNLYGLNIVSGNANFYNNVVALAGNNPNTIYGIYATTTGANNDTYLYHNTVSISGTPASGTNNSYAMYSALNTNIRNFRNNIFQNERNTNGKHFAMYLAYDDNVNLTCNYNNYYVSGTGGVLAYHKVGAYSAVNDITTFAGLQTATAQDANSLNIPSLFALPGGSVATDYATSRYDLDGLHMATITTDLSGTARDINRPTMGAFAEKDFPTGSASTDELNAVKVYPSLLSSLLYIAIPEVNSNSSVRITDLSGRTVTDQPLTEEISTLEVNHFAKGTYIVLIQTDNGTSTFKVYKK